MKILMVGLGGVGQRHLRNLKSALGEDLEPMAYRVRGHGTVLTDNLEVSAGKDIEEEYGITVFRDLDEALAQGPRAVFICNPTSHHAEVALAAAAAGCHLFIEKPLSHSLEHLDTLAGLVMDNALVAMVGYQLRFHPTLMRAAAVLREGTLGQIVAARIEVGEYMPGWHPYEDYRQMYAARKDLGGGVVLSQIHELDYLYWFFGVPSRLFAVGGHLSDLEVDVEDSATSLLEYEIGGRGVPVTVHQDYIERPPSRTCKIVGDRGTLLIDLRLPRLEVFDPQGHLLESMEDRSFQRNQLFEDEVRHFLRCMAGQESPAVSIDDGAQSLRMALAIKESMATGRTVNLSGGWA